MRLYGYRPAVFGTAPPFYTSPDVLASLYDGRYAGMQGGEHTGYVWEKAPEVIKKEKSVYKLK